MSVAESHDFQLPIQPTGIDALDQILNGGIPVGSTILLAGDAGTGKTLLCLEWLFRGFERYQEAGLYISLTEPVTRMLDNASKMEFFRSEWVNPTQVFFTDLRGILQGLGMEEGELTMEKCLGVIEVVTNMVKNSNAKRVVLDSITAVGYRLEKNDLIRRFIFELGKALAQIDATVILTSEVSNGGFSRFGIEEFISDGIFLMSQTINEAHPSVRRLQIMKLRGVAYNDNSTVFQISPAGCKLYPPIKQVLEGKANNDKISMGSDQFDTLVGGGFFRGTSVLYSGPSGSGKTLLALQSAYKALTDGERVSYFSFEESQEQILRNANSFGWDLEKFIHEGSLAIYSIPPLAKSIEEHLDFMTKVSHEAKTTLVVLDSLSALQAVFDHPSFRNLVCGFFGHLKSNNITSIITVSTESLFNNYTISEMQLSTFTDTIIILRYIEVYSELKHGILVLKHRGSEHNRDVIEVIISGSSITLGSTFSAFEGILTGTAREVNSMTKQQVMDMSMTLNSSSLVSMTDTDGNINYVNDKFCEISKYSQDELIGQNHRIMQSGFHSETFYKKLWETILNGEVWKGDIRNKDKNGETFWVRTTILPSTDNDGKITGYTSVRTPITDMMEKWEIGIIALEQGKEIDPETREIIDELRDGTFLKTQW
ncbi:MAG: Circadian clock protein kinase KaiC [Chlamydiia bacterium]|nr:Circadian clock protein kinase KaiC [Chlamydiia bacterium]